MVNMEQYCGITGQVLGLDPFYYEESDVSTFDLGDISKQHFAAPMSALCSTTFPDVDIFGQPDDAILEDLLTQGESLLDQLLDTEPDCQSTVDLSTVDELYHMFPNEKLMSPEPLSDEALSPVPTLPSEPSSPLDLENLVSWEPAPVVELSMPNAAEENLAAMLQDLSDSMLQDSIASPSSLEDFAESIYSSEPTSPSSSELSFIITNSDISVEQAPGKTKRKARTSKPKTPYAKLPVVKKERKKQQNKEAANRYRQKKKEETLTLGQQEDGLLEVNNQLKSDVENLEREIRCIKDLLTDVFNVNSFS